MVLWSFLLVGAPAAASVENVLAPVEGPYAPATPASAEGAAYAAVPEQAAPGPLVRVGADEIDLLAAIESALVVRFQPAGRLRIIPVSAIPRLDPGAPLPAVELVDVPSRLHAGTMLLRYRLRTAAGASEVHLLSFRAEVLAEIWLTQRRLVAGESLDTVDLATREVDILREPKAVPADPALLARYEVARPVAEARPLTWTDITPRALVRKGEVVEVVATEGALRITMKGLAVRSGALGEIVTIRNLESRRDFSAEVIDENKVRVRF